MSPLVLALVLAAAPRAAVVVHTTGFSDDDAQRIADKVRAETQAAGVELWALTGSLDVKGDCLEDRECAREVARTADAAFIVSVNVLRAGGQAAVSAAVLDADGRVLGERQGVRKLDLVLGAGELLAAELMAPLRDAAAAASAPATPPDPDQPVPAPTPLVPSTPAGPAPTDGPQELSPLALGGVATLGAGALAAAVGGAVVAAQLGVLNDPRSLREDKEQAALVLIPALGAVALVGVAVAGAGGVMLWLGLDEG
ncbi:MAG: hypothetical protein HYS27_18365 [Deltaproteobacteria bacterium]|nr:hypothetical protein [Deltaproteobacteria bacterium]